MSDLADLPLRDAAGAPRAVIETPKGSDIKYCFDVASRAFSVSKFLNVGLVFPCDFGFFPSTRADDGDPLDVMVLHDSGTFPGLVVRVRPIGVLAIEQREPGKRLRNDRIIAVPAQAGRMAGLAEIDQLGEAMLAQLEVFLRETDEWEDKEISFLGWKRQRIAMKLIEKAAARYAKGGRPEG
jgi:inorganic pyrophosphatase